MGIDTEKDEDDFFLSNDFEVTYDGDLTEVQSDIKNDAYKDVLSALSELDDTQSFDYLEMNKTRTLRLDEYLEEQKQINERVKKEEGPLKKLFHSFIPGKK